MTGVGEEQETRDEKFIHDDRRERIDIVRVADGHPETKEKTTMTTLASPIRIERTDQLRSQRKSDGAKRRE